MTEHKFERLHGTQWKTCTRCGAKFDSITGKSKCYVTTLEPVREYMEGANRVKVYPPVDAFGAREESHFLGSEHWYLGAQIS